MARISLRAYNRDIEVMIDKNQLDEAFAHCRYILEVYPKHIDTYRLMGKALLEAQRFADAADVFHRVLSSVPDDFIAHLGMSIIREDEGNLDAAIWHMERAFEVQPSNAAVQVELRRLYGLRDGVTPQKIQLTRGALARMSAKSNLYSQAIAELRAALSSDPQRPDLQVVLAEMYFQTGARMEALETCNALINKLPYCMVANRILADVLPETERAEQAAEYRKRSGELDPYYLQLSPVAPTLEQVPDGAVTIERFEYSDEAKDISKPAQPAWAATLGVDFEEQTAESDQPAPEWLEESSPEHDEAAFTSDEKDEALLFEETEFDENELIPTVEQEVEELPDWMSETGDSEGQAESADLAGLTVAAGAAVVGGIISDKEDEVSDAGVEESESIVENEEPEPLPDWMAANLPEEEERGEEDAGEMEVSSMERDEELVLEEESITVPEDSGEAEDLPDWLSEAEAGSVPETPDWLREAMEETDQESQLSPEFKAATGIAAELSADEFEPVILEDEEREDQDDEITSDSEYEAEIPAMEEVLSEESELEIEEEDLAGAALAGAVMGAILSDDDTEADSPDNLDLHETEEEIPDWLRDLGEDVPSEAELLGPTAVFDEQTTQEEGAPISGFDADDQELVADQPVETLTGEIGEPGESVGASGVSELSEFPETIPDWLSEVSPDEMPQEMIDSSDEAGIVKAEIPLWLKKMEAQHKAEMEAAGEIESIEELAADFTDLSGEDVPTWLMSAMETELPEVEETAGVADISEMFGEEVDSEAPLIEIEEQSAEEILAVEIEDEEIGVEQLLGEAEAIKLEPGREGEDLLESVEPAEEILDIEEEEEFEEDQEGISIAGIAAAGVAAAQILEDEETQPVAITAEAEPEEIDIETVEGEPISTPGMEIPEFAEAIDEQITAPEVEMTPEGELEAPEMPPLPADEPLSDEDQDAAMAWLESLAAKQGAAEEELLTPAEKRQDEPPEWVREEASEVEIEEEQGEFAAAALAGIAAEALSEDEAPASEQDIEAVEEEEPPEWVPESELAYEVTSVEQMDRETEPTEIEADQEVIEQPPAAEEVDFQAGETPGEIPDWLSGLAEEQADIAETEPAEWSPEMLAEDISVDQVGQDVLAVEKLDINAASIAQLEKLPGIGFILAQNIVNYRASSGPFSDFEQLENVEGMTADTIADLQEYLTITLVPEVAVSESDIPELQAAWENINQGYIDQAVDQYEDLINQDQHLDEIIRDLQAALGKFPLDSSLYQSLGDAYMHANMLQEALDAYNRAEDLIS
ncbi:MAG: tetratricopeptide repeat protein [Anaerolineales bacterium]